MSFVSLREKIQGLVVHFHKEDSIIVGGKILKPFKSGQLWISLNQETIEISRLQSVIANTVNGGLSNKFGRRRGW